MITDVPWASNIAKHGGVHQAFGPDVIRELAAKAGMTPQELAHKLSQVLPQVVDKLTPNGSVPPH
jgi:uncharacterized protein YidB (DUF937 family)